MSVKIHWRPVQEILKKRGLEDNGNVQQYLGETVARRSDKRVPMDTATLKNTVTVKNKGKQVVYNQPYAAKQYYDTAKTRSYDANRGSHWVERTINAEGDQIVEHCAKLAGGKAGK